MIVLPGGNTRGRVVKKFSELGPYLREQQCEQTFFFFDCLAVCIHANHPPDKREFWGWWLTLEAQQEQMIYHYYFGMYDKTGKWNKTAIRGQKVQQEVEKSLQLFFQRLLKLTVDLNIKISPADEMNQNLLLTSSQFTE